MVIDFEYAGANPAALEFANHFTEWCYDYHDSQGSPAVIRPERYPSPEEQERFLTAYITHLPLRSSESTVEASYSANTGAGAGVITTPQGFNGAESPFSLDATAQRITQRDGQILPVREQQQQGHQKRDPRGIGNEKVDASVGDRVRQMMHDSALWRPANSAQWVCWGIVQASGQDQSAEAGPASVTASVGAGPGDGGEGDGVGSGSGSGVGVGSGVGSGAGAVETVDSFDYLTYAHSRALFFWRDIVQLGVVKVADLPAALRSELRLG